MCIEKLTSACSDYSRQITDAIDRDDEDEVRRVDALLADAFEKIMHADPANDTTVKLKAEFLLGVLVPTAERTKLQDAICLKLIDLVAR